MILFFLKEIYLTNDIYIAPNRRENIVPTTNSPTEAKPRKETPYQTIQTSYKWDLYVGGQKIVPNIFNLNLVYKTI